MTEDENDIAAWRRARWDEIAGPLGKAKVVANARVTGSDLQTIADIPGQWSTTPTGALLLTASVAEEAAIDGQPINGAVEIPTGSRVQFPGNRTVMVTGGNGTYGLVVMDDNALSRSGLVGVETYPYDPDWVLQGEYRAAPPGRCVEVERLTVPRSRDSLPAPVDLLITIAGEDRVLTVLEDLPGRRLLIFTDETRSAASSAPGRWLLLPPREPGSIFTVDFNRAILSQHHLSPAVFTCPTEPEGNHIPARVEAGERALIYQPGTSGAYSERTA